jgi:hypothetical protein
MEVKRRSSRSLGIAMAAAILLGPSLLLLPSEGVAGGSSFPHHEPSSAAATRRVVLAKDVRPSLRVSSELAAVSCPLTRFCVAVGASSQDDYAHAMSTMGEIFTGQRWSVMRTPNVAPWSGLTGVSCVSRIFCVTVGYSLSGADPQFGYRDSRTLVEIYDGGVWSRILSPQPGSLDHLTSVSCASRDLCMAVGYFGTPSQPFIIKWDGSSWTQSVSPSVPVGTLSSVSCPTPTFCATVGSSGDRTLIETFDGTSWSINGSPNMVTSFYNELSSVSCTSDLSCQAVGFYYVSKARGQSPIAESYEGKNWVVTPLPADTGSAQLDGVSCARATSCAAVGVQFTGSDGRSLAYIFDGSAWAAAPSASVVQSSQPGLSDVSCSSEHICMAVGSHYGGRSSYLTSTEALNGTRWSLVASPNP